MSTDIDIIYLGADNTNELLLKVDGVSQDLSSVTQIKLKFDDGIEVTNTTGTAFPIKWLGLGVTGKVILQLGDLALTEGERSAILTTIDPTNQDGIVWSGQNGIRFFVTAAT